MAVDTLTKRQAALRYGMTHLAGTRRPKAAIHAFERAALLGCYWPVTFGTVSDGWTFGQSETHWTFSKHASVLSIAADQTVFTFGD